MKKFIKISVSLLALILWLPLSSQAITLSNYAEVDQYNASRNSAVGYQSNYAFLYQEIILDDLLWVATEGSYPGFPVHEFSNIATISQYNESYGSLNVWQENYAFVYQNITIDDGSMAGSYFTPVTPGAPPSVIANLAQLNMENIAGSIFDFEQINEVVLYQEIYLDASSLYVPDNIVSAGLFLNFVEIWQENFADNESSEIYQENWAGVYQNIEVAVAPVPEPGTMLLLGSGLVGLFGFSRKKSFKLRFRDTQGS